MVDTTLSDQPFQDKTVLTDDRLVFLENEYTQTQKTNLAEIYEYYGDKNAFFPYLGQIDASTTSPNTLLDKSGWYEVVNNTGTPVVGWPDNMTAAGGIIETISTGGGAVFKQKITDVGTNGVVFFERLLRSAGTVSLWSAYGEPHVISNVNGTAYRHRDGRQECILSLTMNLSSETWTFPASFIDTNYILSATESGLAVSIANINGPFFGYGSKTASSALIIAMTGSASGSQLRAGVTPDLYAFGRWF